MSDTAFPTFRKFYATVGDWTRPRRARWRVSTWWPGDTPQAMYHSLLHILAVAHAERLDLVPLLHNLATEHRGSYRGALRRLASRLAAGIPLISALEQTPEVLSEPMILAIRFGSQSGTLAATYDQLLRSRTPESVQLQAAARNELVYWSIIVLAICASVGYLMSTVAPEYVVIADELGLPLPASFQALRGLTGHMASYPFLWVMIALGVGWLIWSARSRKFFRRAIAERFVGSAAQMRAVELLQLLAIAVEAGRPIPGSLSTLAKYHFDSAQRQKLLYARNEVEQGVDVWGALANANILTPAEAGALASNPAAGGRACFLRRLAEWKQAGAYRRDATAFALIRPVVVLFFAAIVLWIATAFFSTLPHFVLS